MPKDGHADAPPAPGFRNLLGYWRDSLADEDLRGAEDLLDEAVEAGEDAIARNELTEACREALAKQWDSYRRRASSERTEAEFKTAADEGVIPVLVASKALGLNHGHGATGTFGMAGDDGRKMFFPLGIPAFLAPDGKLLPNPAAPPWLGRRYLSPNEDTPDGTPVLGEMEAFDSYLDANPYEPKGWGDTVDWCDRLMAAVAKGRTPDGFSRLEIARLGVALSVRNPGRQLIQLYGALLAERTPRRLLLRLCTGTKKPIPVDSKLRLAGFRAPRGTMTAGYGLAPSQSDAVAAYGALGAGDILAVNGPPGTGKTTLLQGIIAAEVVGRALRAEEPAVIVGVTTNNQAVTNINRSMNQVLRGDRNGTEAVWARRWVPDADTLGLFLPSGSEKRVKEAVADGFAVAVRSGSAWNGFPDRERDDGYLARAEATWLEGARAAYPDRAFDGVAGGLEVLRGDLQALQARQEAAHALLAGLSAAEDGWVGRAGSAAPGAPEAFIAAEQASSAALLERLADAARSAEVELEAATEARRVDLEQLNRGLQAADSAAAEALGRRDTAVAFSKRLEAELAAHGLLEILALRLRFLRPIAATRQCARATELASRHPDHRDAYREVFAAEDPAEWHQRKADVVDAAKGAWETLAGQASALRLEIDATTSRHGERIGELRAAHRRCLEAVASAERASAAALEGLRRSLDDLHRCRSAARAYLVAQVAGRPEPPAIPDTPGFADFDRAADITVRHEMFQKAMRYWEGRWILEARGLSDARKRPADELAASTRAKLGSGRAGTLAMFRRWCMLTPCLVSTLHSLPKHFRHAAFMGQVGPKREFASNFLCDGIDLLIMDEAGQVAPHVGAAAFGLAKRAVVVGDVHQIEPVVGCTPGTDFGNAAKHGLEGLWVDGRPASPFLLTPPGGDELQGSVMRLAQAASGATSVGMGAEPGIFLSEHRRCHPDIIGYCNELVYKGRLEPRTPPSPKPPPLRPLNWAHVQGACARRGGSNLNQAEANRIADWIAGNARAWAEHYGRPIEEVVAVVAPFRPQADAVRAALARRSKDLSRVTCGTVHALQGAQRPIVVFSPTYSMDAVPRTLFFDRRPNMLNVLVSRAEDSLVVFGDMRLFRRAGSTPSALLGRRIFADPENELPGCSSAVDRFPAVLLVRGERISTLARHREVLRAALSEARPRERITIVSPYIALRAVAADRIDDLCRRATAAGASVEVVFDRNLAFADERREGRRAAERLRAAGAAVFAVGAIHSKTLIAGDREITEGSFNWLSAQRGEGDAYVRHETSWRISGDEAGRPIEMARKELAELGVKPRAHVSVV